MGGRQAPPGRWKPTISHKGSVSPWEACLKAGWQTAQKGPQGGDGPSHSATLAPKLPPSAGPVYLRLPSHQGAPSSMAHLSHKRLPPLQSFGISHPLQSTHSLDCRREKRGGEVGGCACTHTHVHVWQGVWGRLARTGLRMQNTTLATHRLTPGQVRSLSTCRSCQVGPPALGRGPGKGH